jgi:hypothetical protein
MKILNVALVLNLALGAAACGSSIRGSGNIKTESRPVSDFTSVEVSGSGKLIVQQGETESLTVTADDNLLPYLASEVAGSKLMLGTKGLVFVSPTEPITYNLTVKKLNAIGASGDITVDAKDIQTDSLAVAVSGSGDVSISGESAEQKIAISGSADYKAENFKTKDTSIAISGSAKALVAVSTRLDVKVSGSGDVRYIGKPEITKEISGSGNVEAWTP